ncbi:MAG: 30S ribosomal protein S6 [candidate division WOR-3 bacterium]
MRKYETMVILNPALDEEAIAKLGERIKKMISKEGEVLSIEEWGRREMAYEIKGHKEGFYMVIQFDAPPSVPAELYSEFRMNPDIIRGIVIREE